MSLHPFSGFVAAASPTRLVVFELDTATACRQAACGLDSLPCSHVVNVVSHHSARLCICFRAPISEAGSDEDCIACGQAVRQEHHFIAAICQLAEGPMIAAWPEVAVLTLPISASCGTPHPCVVIYRMHFDTDGKACISFLLALIWRRQSIYMPNACNSHGWKMSSTLQRLSCCR